MTQFTRTINISCENLGGRSAPTIMFTFDNQPMDGIYQDYFPVVWKLSTFPREGAHTMTATYKNQLMFVNPQIKDNRVISAATSVKINLGQQTDLIEQAGSTTKSFTSPTDGAGRCIKAINKTQTPQTIGVGFDNGGTPPSTMLVFDRIHSSYNVTAEFTPILSAYITEDYQENSVLRRESSDPVWRQNLADLKETSNWRLTHDYASGIYSINPA